MRSERDTPRASLRPFLLGFETDLRAMFSTGINQLRPFLLGFETPSGAPSQPSAARGSDRSFWDLKLDVSRDRAVDTTLAQTVPSGI